MTQRTSANKFQIAAARRAIEANALSGGDARLLDTEGRDRFAERLALTPDANISFQAAAFARSHPELTVGNANTAKPTAPDPREKLRTANDQLAREAEQKRQDALRKRNALEGTK